MHTRFNPYPQHDQAEFRRRTEAIGHELALTKRALENLDRVLAEHLPSLARHHALQKPQVQRLLKQVKDTVRDGIRAIDDGGVEAWRTALLDIDQLRTEEFNAKHLAKAAEARRLREMEVFTDAQGMTYQIRERDVVDPETGRAKVETRKVYVTRDEVIRQQEEADRALNPFLRP